MAGVCCRDKKMAMNRTRPLAEMARRETGRVKAIRAANPDEFHQLLAAGLWQGVEVRVVQNDRRHMLVLAGEREVALDRQAAACIWVQVEIV